MFKSILASVLAVVLSLSLLAACSSSKSEPTPPEPEDTQEQAPVPEAQDEPEEAPAEVPDASEPEEEPAEVSEPSEPEPAPEPAAPEAEEPLLRLEPWGEAPGDLFSALFDPEHDGAVIDRVLLPEQFDPAMIETYTFYSNVTFTGAEAIAEEVLEAGKNPGLGVRALHEQGITGAGVNVAIIDGLLPTDHPEFAENIVACYDSYEDSQFPMHSSVVTSFLLGDTTGVAPDANLYYASAPTYEMDATYFADCLDWIVAQNAALPDGEKIRVVSVSAAPQEGYYDNGELWTEVVARATEAGILVIDCRTDRSTGFVHSSYPDPNDRENPEACTPGYPSEVFDDFSDPFYDGMIFAPASYRTSALEFAEGQNLYAYWGEGGQSWAVPYVAGVLALGWVVNPSLDAQTMRQLLFDSCYINESGNHMIDPVAFIEAVRQTVSAS